MLALSQFPLRGQWAGTLPGELDELIPKCTRTPTGPGEPDNFK